MSRKSEKLSTAIKALKDMFDFQDKAKKMLNLEVHELQPSETAGILFDMLTEELLTKEGNDIMVEFVFSIEDYNEDNPMVITEKNEGEVEKQYLLKSVEDLCLFLDNNGYIKP